MNPVVLSLICGVGFGALAVALMLPTTFPNKRTALIAAFASRFAIGFLILLVTLPVANLHAQPTPSIVGKWSWTQPKTHCTETYEFRANGTASVVSGAERTENKYTIGPPDNNGFFPLTMTITKDDLGRDCSGSEENDTGHTNVGYVQFHIRGDAFIVCQTPARERCFGPLKRVP
jgi:hypothetical protein